jgi:hypothetical protein
MTKFRVPSAVFAAVFIAIAGQLGVGEALAGSGWPLSFNAVLMKWQGPPVGKPIPYGSNIPAISKNRDCYSRSNVNYLSNHGWSLGFDGCAQYPEFTSNHGKTWRIGGIYFAIPTTDAAAFVDEMKPFTPLIVAAYFKGESTFDVTWNGGRNWYAAWMPGNVVSVTQESPNSGTGGNVPTVIEVEVVMPKSPSNIVNDAFYISQDHRRKWKLVIPKSSEHITIR